jgi:hypothetical protein
MTGPRCSIRIDPPRPGCPPARELPVGRSASASAKRRAQDHPADWCPAAARGSRQQHLGKPAGRWRRSADHSKGAPAGPLNTAILQEWNHRGRLRQLAGVRRRRRTERTCRLTLSSPTDSDLSYAGGPSVRHSSAATSAQVVHCIVSGRNRNTLRIASRWCSSV